MPPTSPVLGRIKAYAKDANGNLYEIGGGSSVQKLDDLGDVDVVTTPPADGDTIVWDPIKGQWVPGPGGADEVMILGTTPTDPDLELWVDTNATQGPITGTLQGGPGITIGTSTDGSITEIRVDTGEAITVTASGVSVNVDNVTIKVNAQDQLEVIGAGTKFVAGPGMVVDSVTTPGEVFFRVDTGEGIVITPAGVAVNADNVTLQVDPLTDQLKLIAGIDHLSDVDTSTTPPTVGQTLTWEEGLRQWIPTTLASAATIKPGPGINIDDQTNPAEILVSVDPGAAIIHSPDGIAVNVDNVTIQVNANDQLETISSIVAGPGIVADDQTAPPTTLVSVDTGAAIIHTPDGIAVNTDGLTVAVNAQDQLEVISTVVAGGGITVGTAPGVTEIAVDTGAGIVQSPDGIAVNADAVTLEVDATTDQLKLIAGIDHLSDVDTSTVVPTAQDSLIWDSTLVPPIWRPGIPITDGLTPKSPARATTTGTNIILDSSSTPVLDDITLAAGDRVLVKDQTSAIENGLYDVAAGAWTRSADSNTEGSIVNGSAVFIEEGTRYGGVNFAATVVAAEAPWTPDADASLWFIFSSKLDLTAGDGLVLDGRDIRVGAGEGIHVDPDSVRVDLGAGIVHTPDGIAANVDNITIKVNATDQLETISNIVAGAGIVADSVTNPPTTEIAVDTGAGIIHSPDGIAVYVDGETVQINPSDQLNVNLGDAIVKGPNGISVNTDNVTIKVNANDQLETIANFTAGPGIVVDSGTNAPSTIIQVDTGAGIITTADGIAANVDGVSVLVNAADQLEVTNYIQAAEPAGPWMFWTDTSSPVPIP